MTMRMLDERIHRATQLQLRANDATEPLPAGVCGRLTGIALVYNVEDDYGTVFMPGCLSRTITDKVQQGKVKLFADHGPFTDTHIGTVRDIKDVGDAAIMTADLLDTDAGRKMKEYLEAVLASGGETGLSVGFRPKESEWKQVMNDAGVMIDMVLIYKEIELREISITPVPAVPGTDVTSVRREKGEDDEALLRRALKHILKSLPERDARAVFDEAYATSAAKPDTKDAASTSSAGTSDAAAGAESAKGDTAASELASEEDRVLAVRKAFATV